MGIGLDDVKNAIIAANSVTPVGGFSGGSAAESIATSDQLITPDEYDQVIVRAANGTVVPLSQVSSIVAGVRNTRAAGWYNHQPSVLLTVTKQPDANIIDTVDGVKAMIPELKKWIPAGIDFSIMSDRSITIRSSVSDIERSLLISIGLVMMVVLVFLRRASAVLGAAVTVPLSLGGTFAAMWAAGFSIDNLSLMAITICVGFVVDDAIVMIENIDRNIALGLTPMQAALAGAGQIGFTVVSISLSLIAAFIPLLFMSGIIGLFFREFSLTLAFAIAISAFVSLTVTPMICGRLLPANQERRPSRFDKIVEGGLSAAVRFYGRTLKVALVHPIAMLALMALTIVLTVQIFRVMPKGFFPQDDTGLIFGFTEGSPDVSFPAMRALQEQAGDIVDSDPGIASTASFVGGGRTVNTGTLFISVKPGNSSQVVINRLRARLATLPGIRVFMAPVQDIRVGARQGKSQYQFTLSDSNYPELIAWYPKVLAKLQTVPSLVDVSADREPGGLQANVVVDRTVASRLGVTIQAIDDALGDAFSQAQIATIYSDRNSYRVILTVPQSRQTDPNDLTGIYVTGANDTQVPLASVAHIDRGTAPLQVNHQGQFPSVTITYDTAEGATLDAANADLTAAFAGLHPPDSLHGDFAGDAAALAQNGNDEVTLLVAALFAVYIILGILYESLIHPLTIVSTLPSAGLGALIALDAFNMQLTIIAFIGIILLVGLVKKNGIMLVDFAIAAERSRDLSPRDAIYEACLVRFRPILMTTLAAMLGALPLAFASGPGAVLRQPLGIAIVGGLVLSQAMTLYTTPVVYMLLSKLRRANRPSALQKVALQTR